MNRNTNQNNIVGIVSRLIINLILVHLLKFPLINGLHHLLIIAVVVVHMISEEDVFNYLIHEV